MYDIKLLSNENIMYITDEASLKKDNKPYQITVIVTNQRLILLDYPSPEYNYEEDLRVGRGMEYLKKKEEIYSIKHKEILDIISEYKYNKYILKDSNFFYLGDSYNKIKEHIDGYRTN